MIDLPSKIKLVDYFAVYEVTQGDFRLQSQNQNICLTSIEDREILNICLDLLKKGCKVSDLLAQFDSEQKIKIQQLIISLWQREVLEDITNETSEEKVDNVRYKQQSFFFSPFETQGNDKFEKHSLNIKKKFHRQLREASIIVLGLGQVGSTVVRSLALLGIQSIKLADWQKVTLNDVWLGGWYDMADVDRYRCDALKAKIHQLNSDVQVDIIPWVDNELETEAFQKHFSNTELVVLCLDKFIPKIYDAINCACLDIKTPWISYRSLGFEITIGPLVIPGESPCYKCSELRLLSNLSDVSERLYLYNYLDSHNGWETGQLPIPFGADLLTMEIIKYLSGYSTPSTIDNILVLEMGNTQINLHPLLKVPRCPHCGITKKRRALINNWVSTDET